MKRLIRTLLVSAALAAPVALGWHAVAQVPGAQATNAALPVFTHPQTVREDLARIDLGLNSTASFSGRFTQYGADGSISAGTVLLQRPGKVRFEYDAPNPLLIVSDGVTLVQHDKALQTFDRVPLSATPLNYFLKENVDLAADTEVISLQKFPDAWSVTARDGSGELAGTITMVFEPETMALLQWVIVDEFGGQTTVQLSDLVYNQRINPRHFVLREDNRRNERRR
jgi:outer membrane lipoprotein-sorting protein